GGVGEGVGGAGVVAGCEHEATAELLDGGDDAVVVGGDDDGGGALRLAGPLVNVLHQVFAGLPQERFAGQAGRGVAGGDDDRGLHRRTSVADAAAARCAAGGD